MGYIFCSSEVYPRPPWSILFFLSERGCLLRRAYQRFSGSGEISVKDAADHILLLFMYCDFSFDQNIAIRKFHSCLTFLNINKSRFEESSISSNLLICLIDM